MPEDICPECGNILENNACTVCGFSGKDSAKETEETPEEEQA